MPHQLEYNVFKESSFSDPFILILALPVPPHCVGIFLDYEGGPVSLFHVTNHGFLIYKFSSCSFSRIVFPYFNPMKCNDPILCAHHVLEPSYKPTHFFVVPLALGAADAPTELICTILTLFFLLSSFSPFEHPSFRRKYNS